VLPLPWALRAGEGYAHQLRTIAARIRPRHVVVADRFRDLFTESVGDVRDGIEVMAPTYADRTEAPRAEGELAVLQFTSGSRGNPRGLRITTANLAANLRMIRRWCEIDEWGAVSWLPMYHDMGLIGGMLSLITVQTEHALMRPEQFIRDTRGWFTEYGRDPYAVMVMPNFGFERVLSMVRPEHLDGLDFATLTTVISGAERVDPAVLARFARLLEPYGFDIGALMPAYGLAEGTLAVSGVGRRQSPRLVRASGLERRLGEKVDVREVVELSTEPVEEPWRWQVCCGRPLDGLAVDILDEDGFRQPEGVLGEILVQGPSVADGYVDPTPEDAAKLGGGQLHSGDAGFVLDGELYLVGRLGDSLKVHGQSVFVEDIEMELVASGTVARHHATVAAGVTDGAPTVLLVTDRSLGDRLTDALSIIRSFAGDGVSTKVMQVRNGGIPLTSSRKPRRRALWLDYLSGELGKVARPVAG
jgi:acyl-CoA synthetase (AMP-forming)/AMP-acid ligase II